MRAIVILQKIPDTHRRRKDLAEKIERGWFNRTEVRRIASSDRSWLVAGRDHKSRVA